MLKGGNLGLMCAVSDRRANLEKLPGTVSFGLKRAWGAQYPFGRRPEPVTGRLACGPSTMVDRVPAAAGALSFRTDGWLDVVWVFGRD